MQGMLKILLLEDMAADAELEERTLRKSNLSFELRITDNRAGFENALEQFVPDVIISDHLMPSFNSLEALSILQERGIDIPFILVTATVSEEFAVDVIKRGAADYVLKDRLQRLPLAIENAVEKWRAKKEGEKFLRDVIASEAMLSEAEKIAHVGSFRLDLANNEVKWSEEALRIFGYGFGHAKPSLDHFFQRIHPDDRQRIIDTFLYAQKNRQFVSMDFKLRMDDGEIKYLRSEMMVHRDENGAAVTISGFHQDVTESKQNELLWLTLLKSIPDAVININAGGEIIFVNKKSEEVFGYSAMEMIGQPFRMIVPDYERRISEKFPPLRHEKKVVETTRKDGSAVIIDINLGPVETPKGIMTIALLRDVTVVNTIEKQIQANERKFRALIEHSADMIVLISKKGRITYASPSLNKILDYDLALVMEMHAMDFIYPEDRSGVNAIIRQARKNSGETFYCKYRVKHAGGQYRWCEGTITNLLDDPDVEAIVSNFRDITDRRNAEREREKITADLIRQNKDLEQFAFIVSHNLRAPVANIQGLAQSMNYSNSETEKKFIINGIASAVNKLDEIIIDLNQILNDTRVQREPSEMVYFENMVESVKTSISDLIEKSDTVIETDFTRAEGMVTQKTFLFSIFFNLISNSIKYRQENEEPHIRIRSFRENDKLVLSFEDNGIGIDLDKYASQLFGLYKRFHTHIEGKGMGLFMVKTQVETLGGRISVESQVNRGTTFRIEFGSE